jgi:hypothetical protein
MFFSIPICGRKVILRFMQKANRKEAFLKEETVKENGRKRDAFDGLMPLLCTLSK